MLNRILFAILMIVIASSMTLPFDAHNHIHMGKANPSIALEPLSGMAVMSTHPRDFKVVKDIADNSDPEKVVIPCLGIHPWFLHELTKDDWKIADEDIGEADDSAPTWVKILDSFIASDPSIVVGEIGLDNFHFDPITKKLTSDMETQVRALEYQLALATKYQRPVSLHCVRAMGKLVNTLSESQQKLGTLPPRIYFHAFGGKAATVQQLIKTLEKKKNNTKVYFGFAPIINFDSKKTIQVMQSVGIERLVLETDHEDASRVPTSMKLGREVIARALEITQEELIHQTNKNAKDLYGLCWPHTNQL
jgi:TatD DNase family protein